MAIRCNGFPEILTIMRSSESYPLFLLLLYRPDHVIDLLNNMDLQRSKTLANWIMPYHDTSECFRLLVLVHDKLK